MQATVHNRGYSLVELMVALALGSFLAIGLISVFLNTKQSYRIQEASSRRLENGRYALSMMQKDIRASAYRGCLRSVREVDLLNPVAAEITVNSLNTTSFLYNFSRAIEGFEATGTNAWTPALDSSITSAVSGTDVLTLRALTDNIGVFTTADMASTSASVVADSTISPAFQVGDVAMIANCTQAEVFYVTSLPAGAPAGSINLAHAAVATPALGNSTANLSVAYQTGSQVMRIATISYFIRNSANNTGPALWMRIGAATPVEVAEGIENMQVQYGIDTDDDLDPDLWQTANNVTAANWNRLIAIRIALLVANTDASQTRAALSDNRTFNLLGTNYGPFTDRRLRRVYTSTITLRNRAK